MFTKSARFYDAIYSFKDYAQESAKIDALIRQHSHSGGSTLLDVACGTGAHLGYLRAHYAVEGLDLDEQMLDVARERFPDVPFHHADMVEFDLGRQFDAVTCLFSSVGYVTTRARLKQAVANMARHVRPGGVLLVEPWFTPESFRLGGVNARFVDLPDLKIARMNHNEIQDGLSILVFHYLVSTRDGVEYFTERHEIGLFTDDQYRDALLAAGLEVIFDPEGLMNRGLYIGLRGG